VHLDTNAAQFLYATLDYPSFKIAELRDFVKKATGKELCRLSQDAIKKVKNDANFSPLSDWLAKYKPTKEVISSLIDSIKQNKDIIEHLKAIKGKIQVKKILSMIETYDASTYKVSVPTVIKDLIENSKEIKDFKAADKDFTKLMQDKYPLIKEIDIRSAPPRIKEELAWYLSAK
jgi:hypothetical protein